MSEVISVPSSGVLSSGELQAALFRAQPGDVIELPAGSRFVGQFVFPAKDGTVTLRTAGVLPDRRITPADAPQLATIASGVAAAACDFTDASHWTIDGIRFEPNVNGAGAVIVIRRGHHITLDRLLLVVPATAWQRQFVQGNGTHITLTRSHCEGVWDGSPARQDSQCFVAWDGPGPYTITDNYLEAASENVMFGGADSSSSANIPADILIEDNLFTKNPAWKGQPRNVKNLFELKAARRVIVRNNIFERNWADGQSGRAIVFTPRNQDGTALWTVIEDVLFEKNIIRDVPMAFNILGYDDLAPSQQTTGITIRDNDISTTAGMGILAYNEIGRLEIYRNNLRVPRGVPVIYVSAEGSIATPTGPRQPRFAAQRLRWAENTAPNGYIGSPTANGEAAFAAYVQNYSSTVGDDMQQNTPFSVLADHDGQNVDGFRLKVDGQVVQEKPATALVNGTIAFADSDGLAKGQYVVTVAAFNVDGETEATPVTLVITGNAPAAPVNVRFTVL